ncbi:Hypothetical protein A7982_02467 [Minicystis rosea]|nr:Hypothetical protein A7982_02467 [Minicystis rosea]
MPDQAADLTNPRQRANGRAERARSFARASQRSAYLRIEMPSA